MELLKFFTAGNVDDGKSTLIGRLLLDSNSISTDIIETLTKQSKSTGTNTSIDLALLTDGLRAEREQGITIDVAYKYFTTDKRKYIIADTPGHAQYTRNMFTGASNTELAIILIDARHGITEQTRRHSIIAATLGVPHVLVCVNKMDLVNYAENQYETIKEEYQRFAQKIGLKALSFIPVSALTGENVVFPSPNLSWYTGETLFDFLENVEVSHHETEQTRFQVQYVIRPQTEELHDYRGYAGSVLSGELKVGEKVQIYPQEITTTISALEKAGQQLESIGAGESVIVHLADDVDVSRGSLIAPVRETPVSDKNLEATLCWMDQKALNEGQKFILQQNSFRTPVIVKAIDSKIDIHSFDSIESNGTISLNELGKVQLKTAEFLTFDPYKQNRKTGAFILINENTNNTVAAGVLN